MKNAFALILLLVLLASCGKDPLSCDLHAISFINNTGQSFDRIEFDGFESTFSDGEQTESFCSDKNLYGLSPKSTGFHFMLYDGEDTIVSAAFLDWCGTGKELMDYQEWTISITEIIEFEWDKAFYPKAATYDIKD